MLNSSKKLGSSRWTAWSASTVLEVTPLSNSGLYSTTIGAVLKIPSGQSATIGLTGGEEESCSGKPSKKTWKEQSSSAPANDCGIIDIDPKIKILAIAGTSNLMPKAD